MDKPSRFQKVIGYIEEHLQEEIPLEQAAQAGFTSLMQLYRDFYAYTGHSVKEYIRKRRLSNALALIRCSELPLAEIAYTCGYSSQQAMCKAVKSAVAMTPLEYKRSENSYYFPRYDSTAARQVTVSAETFPATVGACFYHPRLQGIEEAAVAALRAALPDYRGRIFGRNGRQQGNRFSYELRVEHTPQTAEGLLSTGAFREAALYPGNTLTVARTIVRNEEPEIVAAWNYLYSDWLKSSMFREDREPYFEEFLGRNNRVNRLALILPVAKRRDYERISLIQSTGMLFLACTREGSDGERAAAHAVMSYLAVYRPQAARTAATFFIAKNERAVTCGVKLEEALDLPAGSGLTLLELPAGSYAVLETGSSGEGLVLGERLKGWVRDHGLRPGGPAFAIYEYEGGYDPKQMICTCRIPLEHVKNG